MEIKSIFPIQKKSLHLRLVCVLCGNKKKAPHDDATDLMKRCRKGQNYGMCKNNVPTCI